TAWVPAPPPLARAPPLRALRLTHCPLIRDLSPLARTTVDRLALHLVPATDLATLAGTGLHALTIRDRRLDTGLHPLPADLPLTELTPDNPDPDRTPPGITRWPALEQVTVTGVPGPAELTELAALPRLRRLTLRRPQPADLDRLTALPGPCRVDLEDVGAGQLDAV